MKKLIYLFACILFCSSTLYAQELKVGAALRVITPDPLIPVSGGVGTPIPATEKKGDLFVRAMLMEQNGVRVAIVGIDNLGWPAVLGDQSKALIKGIPPENILIGATHTHSAPDAYGFPNEKGEVLADFDYLEWCVKQVADAVNEAMENMEPAALKIAVGEAEGKIAYNYYAPDLYDPRCGVIQAFGTTGENKDKAIATLVNYAIHPEVIGNKKGILSPDLCGPLYNRIEAKVGGMAIFMNGAQGGMVTADNRRPEGEEAGDWEECIRIGELLADQALSIVDKAPLQTAPTLFTTSKEIQLPVTSPLMKMLIDHSEMGLKISEGYRLKTRINLLNIGSAQILTIPGEALPNIGYYLKRKMNTDHPFLFGLTNDAFGYILTKEDFNSFKRYEYISKTSLGEETAEVYIEEALQLIEESPGTKL
ncbi:hypothetical protein [uncultured Cyclobacterium sp.]|uniref:hypothetical protein n=1 Tax=uncultured Cyclobacterium sp. TaxID=453820 RepID=UPI0030EC7B11|tara:strand:- start:74985 stop:76250 length:1266 start_codon:yes stop_codon:yes gene_type:complete